MQGCTTVESTTMQYKGKHANWLKGETTRLRHAFGSYIESGWGGCDRDKGATCLLKRIDKNC